MDGLRLDVAVTNMKLPLDLYLIQDLSGSFGDDLPNLQALAPTLLQSLEEELAVGSQFGVGSYVDKPASPYGSSTDYVFQHHLSMTNDRDLVVSTMNALEVLNGGDYPESQLEALNIVANCPSTVGWRANGASRRMVLLSTDATSHSRGHGLHYHTPALDYALPNNDDCVADSWEDVPSLGQVKQNLIASNIIPIFAVSNGLGARPHYDAFVDNFGFGGAETLSSNSDNLFDAIKAGYEAASKVVVLKTAQDSFGLVSAITPADGYTDVALNAVNSFTIDLLWSGASFTHPNPIDIVINVLGFGPIDIEVLLEESCDAYCAPEVTPCPSDCSGHGTCDCGLCTCTGAWTGDTCDCDGDATCSSLSFCSGHGVCECGACKCVDEFGAAYPYVGADCSCLDTPCPGYPECSGHGTCNCGVCTCDPLWNLVEDCSCSAEPCPGDCSGHGTCECGECLCSDPAVFGGLDCNCSTAPCPNGCSGHGECDCGVCDCVGGYSGVDCSCSTAACPVSATSLLECNGDPCDCGVCQCSDPTTLAGPACDCDQSSCPNDCTSPCNGVCECGNCTCLEGWTLGPNRDCSCSTAECPVSPETNLTCNGGNNTCECGECVCNTPGIAGAACDCDLSPCSPDPTCSGHGTCVCGTCECDPGFRGSPDCSTCTDVPCPVDPANGLQCGGRGTCTCGVCTCDDPFSWEGDDCGCSLVCGSSIDENTCYNNGLCTCGECECYPGYIGEFCDCRNATCPRSATGAICGGHGTCDGCGTCECDDDYNVDGVDDCSCRAIGCPSTCELPYGYCECGVCICLPGYRNPASGCQCIDTAYGNKTCARTIVEGSNSELLCSGHGECDECSQECICEENYDVEGYPDCSCSRVECGDCGNGNCTCGECVCEDGWTTYLRPGEVVAENCMCDLNQTCPGDGTCNGHGTCNQCGECECDPPGVWGGLTCDTCLSELCADPDPCNGLVDCESCLEAFFEEARDIANYTCVWCGSLQECHYSGDALNETRNTFYNGVCRDISVDKCPEPAQVVAPPPPEPIFTDEEIAFTAGLGGLAIFLICAAIVLILRLIQYCKDKKEFQAWEEEKKNSNWGDDANPLFQKQEKEGVNPLYAGN